MIPFARVMYRAKKDNQLPFKDFINWSSLKVRKGLNSKSNEIEITLRNNFRRYINMDNTLYFNQDDEIEVYLSQSPIVLSSNLLLSGRLQNIAERVEGENRVITLEYIDRTVTILDKFYATGHSFTSTPSNQIVAKVVSFADDNTEVHQRINTVTYIQTTRPSVVINGVTYGGDVFPNVDMYLSNKTVVEWIQEASLPEYVNSPDEQSNGTMPLPRGMLFYIDSKNFLHWEAPSTTASVSLLSGDKDIYSIDLKKTKRDLINMAIFRMTPDKNGSGITWYYYNKDTEQPELHMKVIAMNDIPKNYVNQLIKNDNHNTTLSAVLDSDDITANVNATTGFPNSGHLRIGNEYVEYTGKDATSFTGLKRGCFGTSTGTHPSADKVEDATTFGAMSNSAFRTECKSRGGKRSAALIKGLSGLKWRGSIEMRGNLDYIPGTLVAITSKEHGLNAFAMRVTDIEHTIGNSWTTTYTFEEDDKVLSQTSSG